MPEITDNLDDYFPSDHPVWDEVAAYLSDKAMTSGQKRYRATHLGIPIIRYNQLSADAKFLLQVKDLYETMDRLEKEFLKRKRVREKLAAARYKGKNKATMRWSQIMREFDSDDDEN